MSTGSDSVLLTTDVYPQCLTHSRCLVLIRGSLARDQTRQEKEDIEGDPVQVSSGTKW